MKTSRHPLPLSVTIVALFVLFITVWNGIRTWVAIADWNLILRYGGNPVYVAASGLLWCIAGLFLFWSLTSRRDRAWHAALLLSALYLIWYWVDRLFLQVSPSNNIPFSVAASIVIFGVFIGFLFWPSSRAIFTRR